MAESSLASIEAAVLAALEAAKQAQRAYLKFEDSEDISPATKLLATKPVDSTTIAEWIKQKSHFTQGAKYTAFKNMFYTKYYLTLLNLQHDYVTTIAEHERGTEKGPELRTLNEKFDTLTAEGNSAGMDDATKALIDKIRSENKSVATSILAVRKRWFKSLNLAPPVRHTIGW